MDTFAAIADPTRRDMLGMLAGREHTAGDFVRAFPALSQPAVSQHLKVLRDAKLVAVRAEAQRRIYSLCPEALAEIDQWIAQYRHFWPAMLDALEQHLDRNPDQPRRRHEPKRKGRAQR